jgi:hypothetical protein
MTPEYFLSASIPDPNRHPKYFGNADTVTIRDAVLALVTVVLPRGRLVFGGHPAITPLVQAVAEFMAKGSFASRVTIYQSGYYQGRMPAANQSFENIIVTERCNTQPESLLRMRQRMFREHSFAAAFFIGGMEGVEEEYRLLVKIQPNVRCYPVASTGAAAALVYESAFNSLSVEESNALKEDFSYVPLFRKLISSTKPRT